MQNCDPNSNFNPQELKPILGEMQRNWPSYSCPSSNSESLWAYQWEKYGTCSLSVFNDQREYFEAGLNLKSKVNVLQILEEAGAIEMATGYTPAVSCSTDKEGYSQLKEVFFCVDASGSNFIQCPFFAVPATCSEIISFNPFAEATDEGSTSVPKLLLKTSK
uniref:Uncharacterized protein n=1 Tax=Nelumbo nucifera TaxID=4432 RepID=A0A822YLA3_NELNU|nr:TPA_asm: hypothetical protein HUJ06_012153 [Nelumbo nucifera]